MTSGPPPTVRTASPLDDEDEVEPTRGAADGMRWIFRLSALAAVVPITVAAVRNGLNGWEPTWDAATTAVRVRDVFSAHPPLVGFVAAPSTSGQPYSFPGAIEAYLLAIPVEVLGTTWGLLLGVAAIQTGMLVAALWLIRRRVGASWAIVASAVVASLLWTFGSEFIVDASPIQFIALPVFALLVAAWSVADGDGPALVVLAVTANILTLGHLALVLMAPLIAGTGLVMWLVYLQNVRRTDAEAWPATRRRHLRWFLVAVAVTVVAWTPSLIEQFSRPDGNLELLARALLDGEGTGGSATWSGGLGAVTSVTAVPPLWLPPNFAPAPFDWHGGGQPALLRVACGVVFAVFVALGLGWAVRHRNRTIVTALVLSTVTWIGWVVTWRLNPTELFPTHYFWGLWPFAAFVWFILIFTVGQAARPLLARRGGTVRRAALALACVAVVATSTLALPRRNHCEGQCASSLDALVPAAAEARATVAREMRGQPAVAVPWSLLTFAELQPSLLLGLQDAGVPIRVANDFDARQFGSHRDNRRLRDATVQLELSKSPTSSNPAAERIGAFAERPRVDAATYEALNDRVEDWLATGPSLADIAQAQRRRSGEGAAYLVFAELFDDRVRDQPGTGPLAEFVTDLASVGLRPAGELTGIPGLSEDDLRDWAIETVRRASGVTYLFAIPREGDRVR